MACWLILQSSISWWMDLYKTSTVYCLTYLFVLQYQVWSHCFYYGGLCPVKCYFISFPVWYHLEINTDMASHFLVSLFLTQLVFVLNSTDWLNLWFWLWYFHIGRISFRWMNLTTSIDTIISWLFRWSYNGMLLKGLDLFFLICWYLFCITAEIEESSVMLFTYAALLSTSYDLQNFWQSFDFSMKKV